MKALVIGAGIVGRAASSDLVRRGFEVTVADTNAEAARSVAESVGASAISLDAADGAAVASAIGTVGATVLISAAPYHFGVPLARAAIAGGAHYLDFGGNRDVVAVQLELDGEAAGAGVAVVPDGGLAPGLINVLAEAAMEALGDGPIQEVRMRVGALPRNPTGAMNYALEFSPQGLINEYYEPCDILHKRRHTTVKPLTDTEPVDWDGIGRLEAFHTSGGSSTMPDVWESRVHELDYKTLRYPGHASQMRAIAQLGLFDSEPIEVAGTTVAPRDVLVHGLTHGLERDLEDIVLGRAWATAIRLNTIVAAGFQLVDTTEGGFSALARTTAYPVTALAALLCNGTIHMAGASPFHRAVTAAELMPELEDTGIRATSWTPDQDNG